MLSLIREWQWVRECKRWLTQPTPIVMRRPAGEEIAKCEACHNLLKIRYFNRLIIHLRVDHKVHEEAAIETVVWIMDRMMNARTDAATKRSDNDQHI
jgi:hypothetical protein